jgi:hypothetical protein
VCSACLREGGFCVRCDDRLSLLPWLQRSELGFFPALLATLKLSVVEPRRYGRAAAEARGVPAALMFGTFCAAVNSFLLLLMTSPVMYFAMKVAAQQDKSGTPPPPPWLIPAMLCGSAVLGLAMFVIGSYAWAVVLRVSSAVGSLPVTIKQLWCIVLYACGPLVVAWVPLAGLFAPAYGVVLTIFGVHEAAASKSLLRSSLVVLLPAGLVIFVFGGGYLALLYYAVTQAQQAAGA